VDHAPRRLSRRPARRRTYTLPTLLLALLAAQDPAWTACEGWPFDAAEAARRQAETAKSMKLDDPLKVPLGIEGGPVLSFRLIPAGSFQLGSPDAEPGHEGDERIRPEKIAEPFYMMDTQLTVEQCRALLGEAPTEDDPRMPAALPYRDMMDRVLPDRARLEYACRAGAAGMHPGGDGEAGAEDWAWVRSNSGNRMHPVAQKKPNAWGLYDVIGNRWHWLWAGSGGGYGDASTADHLVYGGSFHTPASGNGARLANIMISRKPEGARFALLREGTPPPKGHP
jgi:hypothetical protein